MDFSNDLVTMSARANLPTAFSGGGSAGNQLYGWLNNSATVYRIDYNNDLVAASTRGGFLLSMTNNGATSNYVR
jgi:hypothetical protein